MADDGFSARIIVGDSGSHFDPAVVEAFLRVEEQFLEVRGLYDDQHAAAM